MQAYAVGDGGALELLAEADIQASGRYSLEVPSGMEEVILQAVDAEGEVIAAAILESSGAAGETVTSTPMTTESSVEAMVYIEMIAQGASAAEANAIDLRARLDRDTAAAVKATMDAQGDFEADIRALAQATIAAQRAEIQAYQQAGVTTTQEALFDAELAASQSLSAALDAESDTRAAYTSFFTELRAAAESAGADAEQQGRAETSASASFRLSLEAQLDAGAASSEVTDAGVRSAAALEAKAQAEATTRDPHRRGRV